MTREEIKSALIAGETIVISTVDGDNEYSINWIADVVINRDPKIKPRTITVNGVEGIPLPLQVEPKIHDTYWFVCASGVCKDSWNEWPTDKNRFNNGAIHLTQEAAQAHYDALWAPSRLVK